MRYLALVAFFILPSVLMAQIPTLTVTSASISINPAATDSYDIQGAFSGLTLTGASSISLSVGNFSSTIPLTSFVQQPGANVFTYQDATGQAPGWVSSFTLNLDAQTFEAQASTIVLAGLSNPFAVQLGTDQAPACTMVRVRQANPGSYQLTPGDPAGMTCELSLLTVAQPDVLVIGAPATVTFTATPLALSASGLPKNIQLFQADDNAQPVSDPLCTLTAHPNGAYSCSLLLNQSSPGMMPMLLQATVGGQLVLSPGFAVQVVNPATDGQIQQINSIENVISASWPNFMQFGDTAYPRVQSLAALRALLSPPVELTALPFGLSANGLSIYVRSDSGLVIVQALSDLADLLPGLPAPAATPAPQVAMPPQIAMRPQQAMPLNLEPHMFASRPAVRTHPTGAATQPLSCGDFTHDIVGSNQVLVWSPGDIFGFTDYKDIQDLLIASQCPKFNVRGFYGTNATVASLDQFPEYSTIIMNSHGDMDYGRVILLTGEEASPSVGTVNNFLGLEVVECVVQGCFRSVYPNHPFIHALSNSIVYAGFCFSFQGPLGQRFADAFAPLIPLSNTAYFGYVGSSPPDDDDTYGVPLFTALLNQYSSTGDALNAVLSSVEPDDSLRQSRRPNKPSLGKPRSDKPRPDKICLACSIPSGTYPPHFALWNDTDLAYVGNPRLSVRRQTRQPYVVSMLSTLNLEALLDGTSSCIGTMNLNWLNTATGGHLTPAGGGSGQDNFTTTSTTAAYTASAILPAPPILPQDNITVNFSPSPANPPAAQACVLVDVLPPDQILDMTFDGSGQSSYMTSSGYQASANLTWHESWNVHIPFFQDAEPLQTGNLLSYIRAALPGAVVTGTTTVSSPQANDNCTGPPVMGGMPGAPYMGVAAQDPYAPIAYPVVPMFAEIFGGGIYHLCDGNQTIEIGDQLAGYPGWDSNAGYAMFNVDLSQFLGKAASMSMPVSGSLQGADPISGTVSYSGTITLSTAGPCDPITKACPQSPPMRVQQ